jgi:hypothetical protein
LDVKTILDGCWSKQLDIRMGLFSILEKVFFEGLTSKVDAYIHTYIHTYIYTYIHIRILSSGESTYVHT